MDVLKLAENEGQDYNKPLRLLFAGEKSIYNARSCFPASALP